MHRSIRLAIVLIIGGIGFLPLINSAMGERWIWLSYPILVGINFVGWGAVVLLLVQRDDLKRFLVRIAHDVGIDTRYKSLSTVLTRIMREFQRKNTSLSINLVERKINSKEELSRTLERIVALAFKLLEAESAELALFDGESGLYHSSFVLGKPFRTSAQAMLSGAAEGEEAEPSPDVLVQPIAFAGSVLGSLRVALRKGSVPTTGDQEIMRILALQSGLAIINCEYTGELMRMKRNSEESVKAKTGFLANLSHEIRGPLGIMLNAIELVLDGLCGPVNADQLETLKMVRSNGEHLLELINDVLDYAKVEAGKIAPNSETVVVNEILKDIAGIVRSQAEAKNHKLVYQEHSEVLAISCDRRHFRQMLINLLTNAVKYTPNNGTIEVWAERVPGNKVRINVRDSGVGIEEADRAKVFAPFERLENSYAINQVGAGLGMALTKRLSEVNGGQIDFRSIPSEGSHFWLIFNGTKFDSTNRLDAVPEEPEAKGRGEVILLVENHDGERSMIMRYLAHIGFKVLAASQQTDAIEMLRTGNVDLAIIGNEAIEKLDEHMVATIRKTARSTLLPIILVSSRAFVFDIERYLKSGIDLCLIKPIALKKLGRICRDIIDGRFTGGIIDNNELELVKREAGVKAIPPKSKDVPEDIVH